MSLEKLNVDIKNAMKEKNSEKLLALRTLMSDTKNVAIKNNRREPSDDDFLTALNKAIKQRQDSVEQFRSGGRMELALVEETQLTIFKEYLPEQLSDSELEQMISETIASVGATTKKDMGKVMKELSPKLKGKADMKQVNLIISKTLV